MERLAGVGPLEGVGELVVPVLGKAIDRLRERVDAVERSRAERFAGEDTKPDLDPIEPTAVFRREDEAYSRVRRQPGACWIAGASADVIGDNDHSTARTLRQDLVEKGEHVRCRPVRRNPDQHAPRLDVEGGEDVARSLPLV